MPGALPVKAMHHQQINRAFCVVVIDPS
jgi:hypothetical protein